MHARADILTKTLTPLDRPALSRHFVALDAEDRRLRFGIALTDRAILDYVEHIDFERDTVLGVFDDELQLIGVGHLAQAVGQGELGVSVLPGFRGRGIGNALLGRAHMHARNHGLKQLFMHCLSENSAMLHLARKQGMRIVSASGEADAHLALAPSDVASLATELMAERVGLFDYALKSHVYALRRLTSAWTDSEQKDRGESKKDKKPA
jgi:ribosomal protein S18 acetylase RimI-like enzyme